jgi:intracellular septation protein A
MALPIPFRLLVLQLLPILVFLVVDGLVEDPVWAIGAALAFVAFQTVVMLVRHRRFDWLILLDAALIGGLGAISLLSEDDLFFKLKPAIMEGLMVPLFLFLALGGPGLLQRYLERYTAGVTFRPEALPLLRRMLVLMSLLIAVHAGAVVLAALHMSRRAWGLVSGPGFYVLAVPILGWTLYQRLKARRAARAAEEPEEAEEAPPRRASRPRGRRRRLDG